MIVSVLELPVRPGCEDDVIVFYEEHDVFAVAAQAGGFRSGRLLRPVQSERPFLVVAEWDDAAAYDRWLHAPARAEMSELLRPMLHGDPSGAVYSRVGRGFDPPRVAETGSGAG